MTGILPHEIHSEYLTEAFYDLPSLVERLRKALEPHKDRFDAIVFRGMSGALVVPLLGIALDKPYTLVRKEGDASHSTMSIEGYTGFKRYIIVDDLIATGNTVRAIQRKILARPEGQDCVGIVLWYGGSCGPEIVWKGERSYLEKYFVVEYTKESNCSQANR